MLSLMLMSGLLIIVTAVLAAAILARHRAAAAADLAALAAASDSGEALGPGGVQLSQEAQNLDAAVAVDSCGRARRVAVANGVRLTLCRPLPDGSVVVGVELPGGLTHFSRVTQVMARAGPGRG